MDIRKIAPNLRPLEDGLWISGQERDVSYPEGGNKQFHAVEDRSYWFAHRNRCLLEIIRRFPPAGTLFDVGGGNGYVSSFLVKHAGVQCIVVEPGLDGARNARNRGLAPVFCATLEMCGFLPNTLMAVGLFDVLEHIRDDSGFLCQVHSVLMKGGRLYLTAPAHQVLWSTDDDRDGHFRRYTLKQLSKCLVATGYRVEYATYFFALLPLPILLFRSLPSRLGIRRQTGPSDTEKEHCCPGGLMGKLLEFYLRHEQALLKRHRLRFGASCLVVARSA